MNCTHPHLPQAREARAHRGAVLLEVVLALVLFVGAVTVIGTAMTASIEGVERQRLSLHASDLAVTVFSELQLGIRSPATSGAESFKPPFEEWTSELFLSGVEDEIGGSSGLTRVEVVIRHKTAPRVFRLAQVLKIDKGKAFSSASIER